MEGEKLQKKTWGGCSGSQFCSVRQIIEGCKMMVYEWGSKTEPREL